MSKRKSIHTYQSTINLLKKFSLEGESYDHAINRLLDLEEAELSEGYDNEYIVEYNDVSRTFKVNFKGNGLDEVYFYDPVNLNWNSDIACWGKELDHDNKTIVRYIINFMQKFFSDDKNIILLDVMGNQVDYNGLSIRRV